MSATTRPPKRALELAGLIGLGMGPFDYRFSDFTLDQVATEIDAYAEARIAEARAGHQEGCDVFERSPDLGPSRKPCNCR